MNQSSASAEPASIPLSALRQDANLWYKILVLLYDLSNIGSDPSAEKRLSSTTHELYISAPYFTESEAIQVRTTLIDNAREGAITEGEEGASSVVQDPSFFPTDSSCCEKAKLEEAIQNRLANFFEKRRASGDSRPCGPHDMIPIYLSIFGIGKEELKDERFLSRVRRSGLGD